MSLTADERKAIYIKISELSGDNEDIMNSLADLQKDDTERGSGNTHTDADVMDKDGVRWEQKYREMQTKYRERFFGGNSEPIEPPAPDPEPDQAETISFDDLFEKEEK